MGRISEIIPDLGNGQSGLKGIFDKISKRTSFAIFPREFVRIIQPGNYRHFEDEHGIVAFERHFLVVIT